MLLLGFGNKARNGKDTAAEAVRDYFHLQAIARRAHVPSWRGEVRTGIFKYANALYAEVNQWLDSPYGKDFREGLFKPHRVPTGVVLESEDGELKLPVHFDLPDWVQPDPNPEVSALAPYGKHPKLLQWWGTEFRRNNFGQDYWVKRTFSQIPANLDVAMITDVRFPNEAEAVEQRGGFSVNVQRLREDGTQYTDPSRPADHPSETALDGWNWNFRLVSPNGHQAWTAQQAINLVEYLRGL